MISNELRTVKNDFDELRTFVKQRIYEIHAEDKSLFNESDLKMFVIDEMIDGFARKHNKDVEKTIENLKQCLMWLKENNYCKIEPSSFPREQYEWEVLVEHGFDLDGNVVVYMRCKNALKGSDIKQYAERAMTYYYCGAVIKGLLNKTGFAVVLDCTNMGLENMSVSMGFLTLKLTTKLLPDSLRRILVYNCPYFAKQAMKVVLYAMPSFLRNSIRYVDKDSITEYIAEESLPCFIHDPKAKWVSPHLKKAKSIDEGDFDVVGIREEHKNALKRQFENFKMKNQ